MRSITPSSDLSFRPDGYGRDPLDDVFALIEDETTRATAWRLLRENRIYEMERVLRWVGILRPDGTFDQEAFPDLEQLRPGDLEGEEVSIASLSSRDYSNWVGAARVGWHWEITGHFDGSREPLWQSTIPISMESLIGVLDDTGLADHFREAGEEVIWESTVYPKLGDHYEQELARRSAEEAEEEWDDEWHHADVPAGADESADGSVSHPPAAAPADVPSRLSRQPVPDALIDREVDLGQIQVLLLRHVTRWKERLSKPGNYGLMGGMRWAGPSRLRAAAEQLDRLTPVEAYHMLFRLRSESNMPADLLDSVLGFLTLRSDRSE